MNKPELLAPAGNIDILKTAIQAGADAVYCSGKLFGARAFAKNFTNEEIIEAANYVHLRNKLIYITVNTIIFDEELDDLASYIKFLYQYVDGVIVQDLGVLHYIRKNYPDFNVHISTQQNIHCYEDAKFLKNLGVKRIVLARETPPSIIKKIIDDDIEVEVFVHGALCFAYSGNCYFSKEIGGRSGNRGTCAQPCRKKYSLIIDDVETIKNKSLLSMKDLYTLDNIPYLCDLGIASFKIEGRMKSAAYVYQVVKAYRLAIDSWYSKVPLANHHELFKNLQIAFNREYTSGYILNANNNDVVNLNSVNHQGIKLGVVVNSTNNITTIKLENPLNVNDAIRFKEKDEWGMTITKMSVNGKTTTIANTNELVDVNTLKKVKKGTIVLKTKSNELDVAAKKIIEKELQVNFLNLFIEVSLNKIKMILFDQKLNQQIILEENVALTKTTKTSLEEINNLNLRIKEQFSKTNKLPIKYTKVSLINNENLFIPIPLINKFRINLLEKWKETKEQNKIREYRPYQISKSTINKTLELADKNITIINRTNKNRFKSNNLLDENISQINEDNERIDFNHQLKQFDLIEHLADLSNGGMVSPYLNIANHWAIDFVRNFTNDTVYLSVELDEKHLQNLLNYDSNLGILAYSKFPIMISKHCVIGNYYNVHDNQCKNCFKHKYFLKDEFSNIYKIVPLGPNNNCQMLIFRNKIKNNQIYKNCKILLEFFDETEEERKLIIKKYQKNL